MGRYRVIDVKIWTSQDFLRLSGPTPNARYLWLWLLTNRNTGSIPGLYLAYPAQIGAELGWTTEETDALLEELADKGMIEYEDDTGIIYIPNAVKYMIYTPTKKNLTGWERSFDELPKTKLATRAWEAIRTSFIERCHRKSKIDTIENEKAMACKEKEKEKEKEKDQTVLRAEAGLSGFEPPAEEPLKPDTRLTSDQQVALQEFAQHWTDKTGQAFGVSGDTKTRLVKYLTNTTRGGLVRAKQVVNGWMECCRPGRQHPGPDIWKASHTSVAWVFPAAYVDNKLDRTEPDYDQIEACRIFDPDVESKHKHYKMVTGWHPSQELAKIQPELTPEQVAKGKAAMRKAAKSFGVEKDDGESSDL